MYHDPQRGVPLICVMRCADIIYLQWDRGFVIGPIKPQLKYLRKKKIPFFYSPCWPKIVQRHNSSSRLEFTDKDL